MNEIVLVLGFGIWMTCDITRMAFVPHSPPWRALTFGCALGCLVSISGVLM